MLLPPHIDRALRMNGLPLDPEQSARLVLYVDLLLEWNRRINLVSRRDSTNIWDGHILHSLSPLLMLDVPAGAGFLDLGSGGGLPGVPMAIVRGDLRITLLDSIQKKVRALEDIVGRLGLAKVEVVCGRAEELGKAKRYARVFDAVIARAVAPLANLLRWSRPLLRRSILPSAGLRSSRPARSFQFPLLLAFKGGDLEAEIRKAYLRAKGETITEIEISFPGSQGFDLVDKKLVVVEYPRVPAP